MKKFASIPDQFTSHGNNSSISLSNSRKSDEQHLEDPFEIGESDSDNEQRNDDDDNDVSHPLTSSQSLTNLSPTTNKNIDNNKPTLNHTRSHSPLLYNSNYYQNFSQFNLNSSSDDSNYDKIKVPYGLHPNLVSSTIGLLTMVIFWLPIPFLDLLKLEKFELPGDSLSTLYLLIMILCGMLFNGAFIALCFIWGPVMASVGSLLTIVLVQIVDIVINNAPLTLFSVLGSVLIILGFILLVIY